MSETAEIDWIDATWNPTRGCTKVSPGCDHCYAEAFARRWRGLRGHPYERGFEARAVPEKLLEPLRWTEPRCVVVGSMSDLFHEKIPVAHLRAAFEVMRLADWHVYQVVTKRAERMQKLVSRTLRGIEELEHVWLGVSVEDRKHGRPRIEALRRAPAAVRFLALEPLLEDLGELDLSGIDWVLVGGETGWGARPMRAEWVRPIRRQCSSAGVPFYFKDWGGVRRGESGRELDGREHDWLPGVDDPVVPDRAERRRRVDAARKKLARLRGG